MDDTEEACSPAFRRPGPAKARLKPGLRTPCCRLSHSLLSNQAADETSALR
jgi:hypothetical protein